MLYSRMVLWTMIIKELLVKEFSAAQTEKICDAGGVSSHWTRLGCTGCVGTESTPTLNDRSVLEKLDRGTPVDLQVCTAAVMSRTDTSHLLLPSS
jgi:hypothetical protein